MYLYMVHVQKWENALLEHVSYSSHLGAQVIDDDKDDEVLPLGCLQDSLRVGFHRVLHHIYIFNIFSISSLIITVIVFVSKYVKCRFILHLLRKISNMLDTSRYQYFAETVHLQLTSRNVFTQFLVIGDLKSARLLNARPILLLKVGIVDFFLNNAVSMCKICVSVTYP